MQQFDLSLLLENTIGMPIEYEGRQIQAGAKIDTLGKSSVTFEVFFARPNFPRALVLDLTHFTGHVQPMCQFIDKSDEINPRLIIWIEYYPFVFDCKINLESGFISVFPGIDIFGDLRSCIYNYKNCALSPIALSLQKTLYLCNDYCTHTFSEMVFAMEKNNQTKTAQRQICC